MRKETQVTLSDERQSPSRSKRVKTASLGAAVATSLAVGLAQAGPARASSTNVSEAFCPHSGGFVYLSHYGAKSTYGWPLDRCTRHYYHLEQVRYTNAQVEVAKCADAKPYSSGGGPDLIRAICQPYGWNIAITSFYSPFVGYATGIDHSTYGHHGFWGSTTYREYF
jgi:hypothetical protein